MRATIAIERKAGKAKRRATARRRSAETRPEIPAALRDFDSLPDAANVRLPVVLRLFDISAPTGWRWTASGKLPSQKHEGVRIYSVGGLRRILREGT